ncbi:hypothetical protein PIB30_012476 [Stylosanthes scabra]|uniref:Senescence regulator n=1 Tax=Stylosanthes scabra TaxID=79078 RepID=A0ABU6T610_9FABA|nr:hypothetical protein [Stylosanthes scabra]
MADWGGYMNKSSGFIGGVSSMRDEEFDEQDVWGTAMITTKDKKNYSRSKMSKEFSSSSSSCSAWNKAASPRKIPRANNGVSDEDRDGQAVLRGSSAPMDIPDWSKIYGKKKGDGFHEDDYVEEEENENEDDDEDGMIVPPHEWIARKLARSQISSFSVCEGIGRTLKGRDLSKVRNAILTKTGFIE